MRWLKFQCEHNREQEKPAGTVEEGPAFVVEAVRRDSVYELSSPCCSSSWVKNLQKTNQCILVENIVSVVIYSFGEQGGVVVLLENDIYSSVTDFHNFIDNFWGFLDPQEANP